MSRAPFVIAFAAVCGLPPFAVHADAGMDGPFEAVHPLARAELAEVRGGFKIGAFDMNIGVTVRTGVNDRAALTSTFTIDGLDRVRQIGETVSNGLSSLSETLGSTATVAAAASSGRTTSAAPTASSPASPTRGGAAANARASSASAPAASGSASAGPGQGAGAVRSSSPPPATATSGASGNARTASAPATGPTVPGAISIPGLTVSHAVNGLPGSVILNRLNNASISQQVQINLTIKNFRDLLGTFRAGRMASDAVRSALALRGS